MGKEHISIDRNMPLDDINVLIRHENNSRVLKRLYFVKFRFWEDSVEETATKVGVTKKTGYYWQDDWNKGGYAALIPNFCGGRKSKLTDDQIKELRILLEKRITGLHSSALRRNVYRRLQGVRDLLVLLTGEPRLRAQKSNLSKEFNTPLLCFNLRNSDRL